MVVVGGSVVDPVDGVPVVLVDVEPVDDDEAELDEPAVVEVVGRGVVEGLGSVVRVTTVVRRVVDVALVGPLAGVAGERGLVAPTSRSGSGNSVRNVRWAWVVVVSSTRSASETMPSSVSTRLSPRLDQTCTAATATSRTRSTGATLFNEAGSRTAGQRR